MRTRFKVIIMAVLSLLLISSIACDSETSVNRYTTWNDEKAKTATVSIDGKTVEDWEVTVFPASKSNYDYAVLSVLETAKHFGIETEKSGSCYVRLNKDGNVLYLDVQDGTLTENKNKDSNLLIPAPGATDFYCKPTNDDVFVDDTTLKWVLNRFGISVYFHSDYEQGTVAIRFR